MDASAMNAAAQAAIAEWVEDDNEVMAPEEGEQEQAAEQAHEQKSKADDASREEEGQDEDTKEGPDWYHKRLSVVTAKRREAESAKEAAEKRVAELEAQLKSKGKSESLFDDDDDDEPEDSGEAAKLKARLEAIEKKEAEREFDRTVSAAKARYPDLPDVVLFSALANGVDIDDAATAFQTQLEAIVEARIAKKSGTAGSTPKKPPVSVGGKASGGAGTEKQPKAGDGKRRIPNVRDIARKLVDDIMGEDD